MSGALAGLQGLLVQHGIRYFSALEITRIRRTGQLNIPPVDMWGRILPTLEIADAIRERYGGPVRVRSGYRPLSYNRTLPDSSDTSEHIAFRATDIAPVDGDIERFTRVVRDVVAEYRAKDFNVGLGVYSTFVHLDTDADARKGRNRNW